MKRPHHHWCFMPVLQRGPGAGEFNTGEALAIPFRREPQTTVPLSGLPTTSFGGRFDEAEKVLKKVVRGLPKNLQHINVHAAGIDIGSRSHFVAVPEGIDEMPVREFSSFTGDLEQMGLEGVRSALEALSQQKGRVLIFKPSEVTEGEKP
jgi:hypothetical protein